MIQKWFLADMVMRFCASWMTGKLVLTEYTSELSQTTESIADNLESSHAGTCPT
jgi:hypothetical protein